MLEAQIPEDEPARLLALQELGLLDTAPEECFDHITRTVQSFFSVPITLISLVDSDRQWFKSCQGLGVGETSRSISFCSHAILSEDVFVVEDTHLDPRFADSPLVVGDPYIRFYAGYPLRSVEGKRLGTLCIIDREPRKFNHAARERLREFGLIVEAQIAQRHTRPQPETSDSILTRPFLHWRSGYSAMLGRRSTALLAALGVFAAVMLVAWQHNAIKVTNVKEQQQAGVRDASMEIRNELQFSLDRRLQPAQLLHGVILAQPDIDQQAFQRVARELLLTTKGIKAIELARDGVVSHLWPAGGLNEELGKNLLAPSASGDRVRYYVDSNQQFMEGPLRWGPEESVIIGRLPISLSDDRAPDNKQFWGLASVVLDMDELIADVGWSDFLRDHRFALSRDSIDGLYLEPVVGKPGVLEQNPVEVQLTLGASILTLAVVPASGWAQNWPGSKQLFLIYTLIALASGALVYALLRQPAALRHAMRATNAALLGSESRFRDAIEALPDGFVIFDASGRLVTHNRQYLSIYERVAPMVRRGVTYEAIKRYAVEHGQYQVSNELAPPGRAGFGSMAERDVELSNGRWLRIVERPMRDGGLVGIHSDITDLKHKERDTSLAYHRAEEANEAKSRFLANVSHEVRTPLNAVLGLLEVTLDADNLEAEHREYLETAQESACHLLNILNDILDLSKIEAGKVRLIEAPFHLATFLDSVQRMMTPQALEKGLKLEIAPYVGGHDRLFGDEGRICQILVNLVSNAIKYTEEGEVRVSVDTLALQDNQVQLSLKISDTGIGIDPAQIEHLLEPFSQLDTGARKRHGGVGLGLSVCDMLIKLMGGELEISANPGGGTIVHVCLCLSCDNSLELTPVEPGQHQFDFRLDDQKPAKVLLADDSKANQLVIKAMLTGCNCDLDMVDDGLAAVEAFERSQYDIVLMDIQMPNLDGISAAVRIRQCEESPARVPIIAITANAMDGDRERFVSAGMDDYIAKPIERKALLQLLERQLGITRC